MDAFFRCIQGCKTYPLNQVVYQCESCGNLLEVVHNEEALKKATASKWKDLFEKRTSLSQFPDNSGVWLKENGLIPSWTPNIL